MVKIKENLEIVRENIEKAAIRASRNPDEVILVAVTKFHGIEEIRELITYGVRIVGESRIQEARTKIGLVEGASWHFIGHLQTNKAKEAVKMFDFIHSVDSIRLAEELNKRCGEQKKIMPVCIEVNISAEKTKNGLSPADVRETVELISGLKNLRFEGLMTMAPYVDNAENVRPVFKKLRELKEQLNDSFGLSLHHLSMGMTNDYIVAVEEGATMVRIGSAIFA